MTVRRHLTFCGFLLLLCLFDQTLTNSPKYAQSSNSSDEIIEPSASPTARIIDVTGIDNILDENAVSISVNAKEKRAQTQTALSSSVKTKFGEPYWVWNGAWGALIICVGIVLLISLFLGLFHRPKNVGCLAFIGVNLLVIIGLALLYQHVIGYKRHIIRIYFDNASDSKYEVTVNGEQFPIDGTHFVIKEISWTGFSESREEAIEIRILSAAPQAEEIERYKIRIKMDKSNRDRPTKQFVYNIGGVNKYTIKTQKYGY